MPLADENRHGPTDVACELDSRRANLTSALGSIESEQSVSRGSCFVAAGEPSRRLPLRRVADLEQQRGSATTEPLRYLGLRGRDTAASGGVRNCCRGTPQDASRIHGSVRRTRGACLPPRPGSFCPWAALGVLWLRATRALLSQGIRKSAAPWRSMMLASASSPTRGP
jgi:hypothetical protein